MAWMRFSNYRKRFWKINYDGTVVYITLVDKKMKLSKSRWTEVRWRAAKFSGVDFKFNIHSNYVKGPDWKEVFKHLRISLAYGTNQSSRKVTDKIMNIKEKSQNPIHFTRRTSKAL